MPIASLCRSSRGACRVIMPERLAGRLRFSDLPPAPTMEMPAEEGARRAYVNGGAIVLSFLRNGLVVDMVITQVPLLLLGRGRRLLRKTGGDVPLCPCADDGLRPAPRAKRRGG